MNADLRSARTRREVERKLLTSSWDAAKKISIPHRSAACLHTFLPCFFAAQHPAISTAGHDVQEKTNIELSMLLRTALATLNAKRWQGRRPLADI